MKIAYLEKNLLQILFLAPAVHLIPVFPKERVTASELLIEHQLL